MKGSVPLPPPQGVQPSIPEGWKAEWSFEYQTWYYVRTATNTTQWDIPTDKPAAPLPPPPYATTTANTNTNTTPYPPTVTPIAEKGMISFHHHHNPPPPHPHALYIHSATFGAHNITQAVRNLITPTQTLTLHMDSLTSHFGDPSPGHVKQFSVLYSYGQKPWEMASFIENRGVLNLTPEEGVNAARAQFVNTSASPTKIIAVVWGTGNGLTSAGGRVKGLKIKEIEIEGRFEASNRWMGFDGAEEVEKMAVAYYRLPDGGVGVAAAREGETCRLPWNPLVNDF